MDVVMVDFMSDAKRKKLDMYMRKRTACEQVVGNNDKFQVTSHRPIPEANHRQPHPGRTCVTKCNTCTQLRASGKSLEGVEPTIVCS